jgi:hypothetical protein
MMNIRSVPRRPIWCRIKTARVLEYDGAKHAFHFPGPGGYFDEVMDATAEFLLDRLAAD